MRCYFVIFGFVIHDGRLMSMLLFFVKALYILAERKKGSNWAKLIIGYPNRAQERAGKVGAEVVVE